ncbi:MAG: ribosomal protein S18-alanine N-acetyltransferase [Mucispirillum sp.]|nr:ribosomal protein S18-alanine N-acetyltransferase [Mucispirillum sp.]
MIRKASLEDLDDIYNIEVSSFETPWEKASIEVEFYKDYASIYVYEVDKKVVAYIITWLLGCEAELITIAVDEGCRRQGIGRALFANVKMFYDENVLWHLEVACENSSAIQMYKSFGFEITSTITNYYGDGKNAFRMILSPNKK